MSVEWESQSAVAFKIIMNEFFFVCCVCVVFAERNRAAKFCDVNLLIFMFVYISENGMWFFFAMCIYLEFRTMTKDNFIIRSVYCGDYCWRLVEENYCRGWRKKILQLLCLLYGKKCGGFFFVAKIYSSSSLPRMCKHIHTHTPMDTRRAFMFHSLPLSCVIVVGLALVDPFSFPFLSSSYISSFLTSLKPKHLK